MHKSQQIFELFNDVKAMSAKAQGLDLPDVHSILNYVSDRLIMEYHQHAGDTVEEVSSLSWNEDKWPSATAVLLEMKSMILNMEQAEQRDQALADQTKQAME